MRSVNPCWMDGFYINDNKYALYMLIEKISKKNRFDVNDFNIKQTKDDHDDDDVDHRIFE